MSITRRGFIQSAGLGTAVSFTEASHGDEAPKDNTEVQWRRSVPVRYEADVAVMGGGIAGVCAALAAGRCLSADQLAMSSARVMTTCAMMGQAAGNAAALAAKRGCTLAEIDPTEMKQRVIDHGARLNL